MANEFKVKKGLIVEGSGGTILDIQGSVGQLFSITDSLTGDLFAVSDISGIPILNVNSSGAVDIDGDLSITDDVTLSNFGAGYLKTNVNGVVSNTATIPWATVSSTPTTISGYGITDALVIGTTATTAMAGNTLSAQDITDIGNLSGTNTGDQTLPTLSSLGGASSGYLTNTGGAKLEIQNGVDGGGSYGIYMWTSTDTNWGIYMAQAGDEKALNDGTASAGIDSATGHAIRFRVNDNSAQGGFIWENSSNETLMQLNGGSEKLYTKNAIYPSNQTTNYVDSTRIANWQTAYTDRNKWDGGSTGLTASTGRASLGLGTAATAAATAFATSGHNHAGVYALEYENMSTASGADHDMHIWRKNHASYSNNGSNSTYLAVHTNVPQDSYSMGGFTLVYQDEYNSSGEGGEIKIYGYWNPESNSGFIGFRYECSNPYHTPTIEVGRNSTSGKTSFFISGEGGNYAQLIAKDLWLGYSAASASSQWGDSWVIEELSAKDGYTNFNTLDRNDFAAITTNGATPSLTGGVTAAEVRTLIGAGTGNGSSNFDGAYSSLSGTPTIPSGNAIIDWTADQGNTNIHSGNYSNTQLSQEEVLGMLTAGANITITTDGEISATDTDTVYTHPTTAGNKHIPSGGASGQFLRYSASGTASWATPSYTTNTDTTYSAGTGLDLTGTTFSIEPDLRDGVTRIGKDTSNYIAIGADTNVIDFHVGGVWVARMESDGDLHMKGDVIAFSDIFNP